MADARLYEVRMAKGTVYALRDIVTGTIWTERSEHAAHQFAREKHLSIIDEQSISHEELLRLIGHEPVPKPSPASTGLTVEKVTAETAEEADYVNSSNTIPGALPVTGAPASVTLPFPVRYHLEDEPMIPNESHLISRLDSIQVKSVFCSEREITPKTAPLSAENGDGKIEATGR